MSAIDISVAPAQHARRWSTSEIVILSVVIVIVLLAVVCLLVSLAPSAGLAQLLVRSVGEARSGAVMQDLAANLGARLRLVGGALGLLAVGLFGVRRDAAVLLSSSRDVLIEAVGALRSTRPSPHMAALGAISLVAIGVRLTFVGQPMRYDEALTFNEFASRPLYYGLSYYPEPNNHLLNTFLVHLAARFLGGDPWVIRLPALVTGVLLVPATFWFGRLAWGSPAGLLAAAVVAGSSYLVEYSTNSRGYTLQALCFVLALCLALVAVRQRKPSPLLGLALVLALGAYAVPTMVYGIAILGMWLLGATWASRFTAPTRGQLVASAIVLGLVCVIAYSPVVLISGPDRLLSNRFVVSLPWTELATELPRTLVRTWAFWTRDVPLGVTMALVAGFAAATVVDLRQRQMPLGILAVAVCATLIVAQRVAPFERVWLFLLPPFAAIACGGLLTIARRLPRLAVPMAAPLLAVGLGYATLTSGSILISQETGAFPDAEAVASTLSGRLQPDDAVMTLVPASLPELQYYFPRYGLPIQTLVRPMQEASTVYVVAESDAAASGIPAERLEAVARLAASVVYRVRQ